jgi:drug/metabolite transporter (DMT)-like permease
MFRTVLALLSTLQVGARIRESIERSLRQAILIAVAAVLLLGAACFGLFAGYQALVLSYGFTPPEAAGIVAAALALLGLVVFVLYLLLARKRKTPTLSPVEVAGEGAGLLDQSVNKAMQQVGPVTLLAIAFIAGVLISRRK